MELAHDLPLELESVTRLLLRIYLAEGILIPRILRLADREILGEMTSAAVLFRGNSILTKSVEHYFRLVGADFLEASIGEPLRRLCADKVELELDPLRLKPGIKEKDLVQQAQALTAWVTIFWDSIYAARPMCPQ